MTSAFPIPARPVKLFRNGRNQSVRIPRDFELPGTDATIRKDGDRLIIEAVKDRRSLADVLAELAALPPLDDDWPAITDDDLLPLDDVRV